METITIGANVQFESFSKPKTTIVGEVVKIYTSKKDNKEYCQVKSNNKLFSKQLTKVTLAQ